MEIAKVVIEIPKSSRLKYEMDKKTGKIFLDRVLSGSNRYPQNYGFIEETLDHDGDPMDILIISDNELMPGIFLDARVIGAMGMIDGGERDTKFIGVINSDPRYSEINDISDISPGILDEIEDFFKNYKNLEKKEVVTNGFISKSEALKLFAEGRNLYSKGK